MARSLASDFMAGVDPTGTRTFQYGMNDAQAGGPSGLRRTVGTVGGVVGGALAIPAAVGGTVGAIKGFAMGQGGMKGRLLSAGKEMLSGAVRPYSSLYHGAVARGGLAAHQAGKAITPRQATSMQRFAGQVSPVGGASNLSRRQIQAGLHTMNPAQISEMRRRIGGELAGGAGALGLSGVISGASANLQYSKGARTQQDINRQLGKTASLAGFFDEVDKISNAMRI